MLLARKLYISLIQNKIPILGSIAWRLRKLILPRKIMPLPISGTDLKININPQSYMGTHLYFFGRWENQVTNFVLNLDQKDVIVDIGAHIGYYSLLFTEILTKEGKIIAFEPGEAYNQLSKNILYSNKKIEIEQLGVSDRTGEIYLKGDKVVSKNDSFDCQINCVSLDDYVFQKKITKIDIVKIDIEGYELSALKGMTSVLKEFRPKLLVEIHPLSLMDFGATNQDVESFLEEMGYNIQIISHDSLNNYMVYCS